MFCDINFFAFLCMYVEVDTSHSYICMYIQDTQNLGSNKHTLNCLLNEHPRLTVFFKFCPPCLDLFHVLEFVFAPPAPCSFFHVSNEKLLVYSILLVYQIVKSNAFVIFEQKPCASESRRLLFLAQKSPQKPEVNKNCSKLPKCL